LVCVFFVLIFLCVVLCHDGIVVVVDLTVVVVGVRVRVMSVLDTGARCSCCCKLPLLSLGCCLMAVGYHCD
jgi:hypothetical protein